MLDHLHGRVKGHCGHLDRYPPPFLVCSFAGYRKNNEAEKLVSEVGNLWAILKGKETSFPSGKIKLITFLQQRVSVCAGDLYVYLEGELV